MKKKLLLNLLIVPICLLTSCNENTSSFTINEDETIAKAITTLQENSYTVDTNYITEIVRPYDENAGIYQSLGIRRNESYNIKYQFDDLAVSIGGYVTSVNLLPKSDGTYDETYPTTRSQPTYKYFKAEDGSAYKETLNIDNTVTISTMANLDETNGIYTPIMFDNEFRNPFDYLNPSDITKDEQGIYHLATDKALFVANCYQRTSLTKINDAVVSFDNGNFASITYTLPTIEASNYTQNSSYVIAFTDINNTTIKHTTTYTNNNPELIELFAKVKAASSFTYVKDLAGESQEGISNNATLGYYTQDLVYFHRNYNSENPDAVYYGSDYDYVCLKDAKEGIYYTYDYEMPSDSGFTWTKVYLSGSTPLTYSSFYDITPTFFNLDTNLFIKNEDGTYSVVEEFESTIGTYFDNQFDGVHTDLFDGSTTKFKLTITDTGFKVNTQFLTEGNYQDVNFIMYDLNSTTIPEYLTTSLKEHGVISE